MKTTLKEELEAGATAYDEMLKNDPRLRLEIEAKERLFLDKQDAKRKEEKVKEERKRDIKRAKRRGRRGL